MLILSLWSLSLALSLSLSVSSVVPLPATPPSAPLPAILKAPVEVHSDWPIVKDGATDVLHCVLCLLAQVVPGEEEGGSEGEVRAARGNENGLSPPLKSFTASCLPPCGGNICRRRAIEGRQAGGRERIGLERIAETMTHAFIVPL